MRILRTSRGSNSSGLSPIRGFANKLAGSAVSDCTVRWYAAYPLILRHIEEMIAERVVFVDHSTVSRWAIRLLSLLEKIFRKYKRSVGGSWRMDETYIKVKRAWKYLYRAVDKEGKTIDFRQSHGGERHTNWIKF